jgi:hypothetical protein
MRLLKHYLHLAGVDRAVVFGVLSAVQGVVAGPLTALLIAAYFTPELQGFFYTFNSLLAIQIVAELGLGSVIIQFASHEWADLSLDENGRIEGSPTALSRLASLARIGFRWYAIAGSITVLILAVSGYLFFSGAARPEISWLGPWLALCALTGATLALIPLWCLLEGCNQVARVYAFRFGQGLVSTITILSCIALGTGLWAAAAAAAMSLCAGVVFLRVRYRNFFRSLLAQVDGPRIGWKTELLPMQWRIAVSWLSGYFVYWTFTPVLFHFQGPVVAGQMGMTWWLVSGISGVSSLLSVTKAPQFGMLIARRDFRTLDRLFVRLVASSLALVLCGAAAIWALLVILNEIGHPLADRLLPPIPTGLFLIATVVLQVPVVMGVYLRAHKREPLLVPSVISGIAVAGSNLFLGSRFGAIGMAAGYFAVILANLPVSTIIWLRCRADWHAVTSEPVLVAPDSSVGAP